MLQIANALSLANLTPASVPPPQRKGKLPWRLHHGNDRLRGAAQYTYASSSSSSSSPVRSRSTTLSPVDAEREESGSLLGPLHRHMLKVFWGLPDQQ
ncbi:hypothetical protein SKAU_G00427690 [Synaphobranchus kaupii]|uniref:Uncharacterized protein n=1 Tax=Synaphobranchus kaupii TaxID=118154 RepID=A0A9Q1E4R6_SYNKA|nr:hypothetical protein SKAU_G00427690 [Synaphobranchus kaupii]